ncbi:MAG: AAA family ATPase [Deltaproteobacteria bacterium]|nr:AAA family ATPase [Deltaproteobacteria bacterium]
MPQLTTVDIENYRCFQKLAVEGLSRVNLFVGRNNSGKTAFLEAVEAVVSESSPFVLYRASVERGEVRAVQRRDEPGAVAIDIRRWFHGHRLEPGVGLRLKASGEKPLSLSRTIEANPDPTLPLGLMLTLERHLSIGVPPPLPIMPDGFLGAGSPARFVDFGLSMQRPVCFVTTRRLSASELLPMWSKLVLTPSEGDVLTALQSLEPSIDRFAMTGSNGDASAQVLFKGAREPVPLGSLGEGTTRMLTLALSLATARGGVLLIDEIETGLHYTSHRSTWRLVIETAKRLDVQVFATTHSKDCLEAVARLYEDAPDLAEEVTIHRLEAGATTPVRMTVAMVASNVESNLDVR